MDKSLFHPLELVLQQSKAQNFVKSNHPSMHQASLDVLILQVSVGTLVERTHKQFANRKHRE